MNTKQKGCYSSSSSSPNPPLSAATIIEEGKKQLHSKKLSVFIPSSSATQQPLDADPSVVFYPYLEFEPHSSLVWIPSLTKISRVEINNIRMVSLEYRKKAKEWNESDSGDTASVPEDGSDEWTIQLDLKGNAFMTTFSYNNINHVTAVMKHIHQAQDNMQYKPGGTGYAQILNSVSDDSHKLTAYCQKFS